MVKYQDSFECLFQPTCRKISIGQITSVYSANTLGGVIATKEDMNILFGSSVSSHPTDSFQLSSPPMTTSLECVPTSLPNEIENVH